MKRSLAILILLLTCALHSFSLERRSSNVCGKLPTLTGIATVIDGDTITINTQKVRLSGIDAPETKQRCKRKNTGKLYHCGAESKDVLSSLIKDTTVTCCKKRLDVYKRILAECFIDEVNINELMIATGNAVTYQNSESYKEAQCLAKKQHLGIWNSNFDMPWDWRKTQKQTKDTIKKH